MWIYNGGVRQPLFTVVDKLTIYRVSLIPKSFAARGSAVPGLDMMCEPRMP